MTELKYKYDKKADAIYIHVGTTEYAYGNNLDLERRIDYDINDKPIGVELLSVSEGVILDDLPFQSAIEKILIDNHIKVYA